MGWEATADGEYGPETRSFSPWLSFPPQRTNPDKEKQQTENFQSNSLLDKALPIRLNDIFCRSQKAKTGQETCPVFAF